MEEDGRKLGNGSRTPDSKGGGGGYFCRITSVIKFFTGTPKRGLGADPT